MIKNYDTEAGILHKLAHRLRKRIGKESNDALGWDKPLQDAAEASLQHGRVRRVFCWLHGYKEERCSFRSPRYRLPDRNDNKVGADNGDLYDQAILTIDELERTTVNLHRELHRVMGNAQQQERRSTIWSPFTIISRVSLA